MRFRGFRQCPFDGATEYRRETGRPADDVGRERRADVAIGDDEQ